MALSPGPVLEDSERQSLTPGIPRQDAAFRDLIWCAHTKIQQVLHCPPHNCQNVSWKKRHIPHLLTPGPVGMCTSAHGERGKGKMNTETR